MNFKTPKDWNKLLTLFHVLNERSFSKAADSLNLTQSAISKHVSKLEHSYKRKLLFRNKNDIKPTEDGLVIYEKLGEVISLLTDIEKTFKESGNKTLFKVYCSSNLLTHWFLDIFLDYKKTNPLLDYDFYGSDYNFDINVNDYDIIISNLHIDHKIYHKTFLGKMGMTLYASPSY
jgi:DNA-binding transcriptional LysR family regulator